MRSPSTSRAGAAIEIYHGARPPEADALMSIVRAELVASGVIAAPRDVQSTLLHAPRASITDPTVTAAGLADELELGVKAYLRAEYEGAIVKLEAAISRASANPGAVVTAENTRLSLSRAIVGLALSYNNVGKPAQAVETMTTYLRSTNEPVPRKLLGPPGEQLYNQVRKSLEKTPRGSLAVNVNVHNAPPAQIFLNMLRADHGAFRASDLLPGKYRVVVLVGESSRRYDVTILPELTNTLDIDWAFDLALEVSDRWVGLTLEPNEPEKEYVRRTAQRMGNMQTLTILSVRQEGEHLAVMGTNYGDAPGGYAGRVGEVHVMPAGDEAKLRALARFLARGEPSPDVYALGQRVPTSPRRWPAIPLGGAALAGLGGGYLLYRSAADDHTQEVSGVLLATGGVIAGITAIWFLARRPARRVPATAFIDVRRASAEVALAWSF